MATFPDSRNYAALSFLNGLFIPIYALILWNFAGRIYLYKDKIQIPVGGWHPLYGKKYAFHRPTDKSVFFETKYSDIKDCYLSIYKTKGLGISNKGIVIIDKYGGERLIGYLYLFSEKQLRYIVSILKKYAGSKSGIPADEFKKDRKRSK